MSLVAVYGTLKRNQGNHRVISRMHDATYVGTSKTKDKFTMYDGGFPMVVEGDTSQITVEVYNVPELDGLDYLEGHPVFFRRERVEIEDLHDSLAWMYIYQGDPTTDVIPSGVWRGEERDE